METIRDRAVTSPSNLPIVSPPSSIHHRSRTAGSGSLSPPSDSQPAAHTRSLTRDFVAVAAGRPMVSLDPALHTHNLIAQRRLRSVSREPTGQAPADGEEVAEEGVVDEQIGVEQLQAQIDFVREFDWRMRAGRVLWSSALIAFCVIILTLSTEAECDLPLVTWLYGYTLVYTLHLAAMIYNFRNFENRVRTKNFLEFLRLIFFIWWVLGQLWLYSTGPESCDILLWYSCLGLMVVEYVHLCSPCLFAATCCCWSPLSSQIERVIELQGATKKQIKSLPLMKFNKMPEEDDKECTICLVSYEKNDNLRILPCEHRFHADCIDIWLTMNRSCPLCRSDIIKAASPKASPAELLEPLSNAATAPFSTVAGSSPGRTLTTESESPRRSPASDSVAGINIDGSPMRSLAVSSSIAGVNLVDGSPRSPAESDLVAEVNLEDDSPQPETTLERKSSVKRDDRSVEISIESHSDT